MSSTPPAHSLVTIPVILLGCGGVGQRLLAHILQTRELHAARGVRIVVGAVCDSKVAVMGRDIPVRELQDATLREIWAAKACGSPLSGLASYEKHEMEVFEGDRKTDAIFGLFEAVGKITGLVVVDCSASEETSHLLSRASCMGCCVVLANKKPLTSSLELYDQITLNQRRLRYESTVGAGLPVICALVRLLASGDHVQQIIGALSGTLGYVMSGLQAGLSFSSVVQKAKSLGYTEPDPRDDLSGMDVARKALILARCLGWRLNLADVEVECLFPSNMGPASMSIERFMSEGLPTLDTTIAHRVEYAASTGYVLRYVATIKGMRCKVGMAEVPRNSPLGCLEGSDNLVEVYSQCYNSSPLVIQGAGAGNDSTAGGVLADIVDLQDLFRKETVQDGNSA